MSEVTAIVSRTASPMRCGSLRILQEQVPGQDVIENARQQRRVVSTEEVSGDGNPCKLILRRIVHSDAVAHTVNPRESGAGRTHRTQRLATRHSRRREMKPGPLRKRGA